VAFQEQDQEFLDRVVYINRCAKVVKGGKRFHFSAVVVVGDGKGKVGYGIGKAHEVPDAIRKGMEQAKKNMVEISIAEGDTIPHEIVGRRDSSRVLLKPAGPGTGVIAGGAVRAVMEVSGIKNILSKVLGSSNAMNVVAATIDGLVRLETPSEVQERRGKISEEASKGAV
jgi:small subunit ribosomal protein S5